MESKLFKVEVLENDGIWYSLPEKHQTEKLAIEVGRKEALARQQKTRVGGRIVFHPIRHRHKRTT